MAYIPTKSDKLKNMKECAMVIQRDIADLIKYGIDERIMIPDLALCSDHLAHGFDEIQDMIERIEVAN